MIISRCTDSWTSSYYRHVCLFSWNNYAPTGRIIMKFYIWGLFESLLRKFKFYWNLRRITGTLHEDQCTFMIMSSWIILRRRNFPDKLCRENQNSHSMFSNPPPPPNPAFYEIMWKNMVDKDRLQLTIQYSACAVHTEYRHILRICNTYCFSTATVVTRKHHNVNP